MGAVEPLAFEVFDPGRPVGIVEDDAGDERIEFQVEPVRVFLRGLQHPLARAHAPVIARRQRGIAQTDRVFGNQPPIVRVGLCLDEVEQAVDRLANIVESVGGGMQQHLDQCEIAESGLGNGLFGVEPAVPAVPRRVRSDPGQRALHRPVTAVFEPHEILPHGVRIPRRVAGQPGDPVPVGIMRVNQDHRIVRSAPAEGPGPRVKHAVDRLAAVVAHIFRILRLHRLVGIVTDEEIPAHRVVLGCEAVKRRHIVIIGQTVDPGLIVVGAGQQARVAAGFEQQHAPPRLGQPRRQGPAARAGADDDIVECVAAVHRACSGRSSKMSSGTRSARFCRHH